MVIKNGTPGLGGKKDSGTDGSADLKLAAQGTKHSKGPDERKIMKKFKNLNKVKLNAKNNGMKSTQM